MTDYSRMSYQELCKIANDDAVADSMSEEQYEALSIYLWKKFRVEKRIIALEPIASHEEQQSMNNSVDVPAGGASHTPTITPAVAPASSLEFRASAR